MTEGTARRCMESDSRRLRVLVISHLFPHPTLPHAGIFVREQLEALSAAADVTVIVGRYGLDAAGEAGAGSDALKVIEVQLPWLRALPSALRMTWVRGSYYRAALRAARAAGGRFDIVHAHYGYPDGLVAIQLGKALSAPVVVTLHGSDYSRQMERPIVGPLIGCGLARADRIIAVTEEIAAGMAATFARRPGQVLHMANGYNSGDISVHAERDPKYFLFVGSLIPRKNPDVLLEAYARIADQTTLNLAMVGDGPMMSQLREQAARLGIADRVQWEGLVSHELVDGYFGDAAALVLPSSREGMPIIINEALASGTPVIATRLAGIAQQVTSELLGTLVGVGEVQGFADAMLRLARRPGDYASIARESGVRSWAEYAEQLLALYCALAEPGGRRTGFE